MAYWSLIGACKDKWGVIFNLEIVTAQCQVWWRVFNPSTLETEAVYALTFEAL